MYLNSNKYDEYSFSVSKIYIIQSPSCFTLFELVQFTDLKLLTQIMGLQIQIMGLQTYFYKIDLQVSAKKCCTHVREYQ